MSRVGLYKGFLLYGSYTVGVFRHRGGDQRIASVSGLFLFKLAEHEISHYAEDKRGGNGSYLNGLFNRAASSDGVRNLNGKSAYARNEYSGRSTCCIILSPDTAIKP